MALWHVWLWGNGRVVALTMSDHPICARCVIFIGPYCSISLRHTLSLSDPMTASDPGIPPAPPDTVGQVGEVLLGGCPGSGMREMGIPCECRGHIDQALALGSRQRTGYWECGRGMGRVVMAPRGSLSHGAVDTCLAHLLSKCPLSLPHFSPPKKASLIGSRALTAYGDVDGSSAAHKHPGSSTCTARRFRRSDPSASASGCVGTHRAQLAGAGSVG